MKQFSTIKNIKKIFAKTGTQVKAFSLQKVAFSQKTLPLHSSSTDTAALRRSRLFLALACFLLAAFAFCWLHTERSAAACQASIAGKILRLHVLANSDSSEDQALKLTVRDGILAYMDTNAPEFADVHEAKAWTALHMEDLRKTAEKILLSQGCGYAVSLELATCYFPVKTYGDLTFPAGDYDALRVKIGKAKGKNWWCVMYPPLCFTDATCCEFPEESREILERQLTETEYLSLWKSTLNNTGNADNAVDEYKSENTISKDKSENAVTKDKSENAIIKDKSENAANMKNEENSENTKPVQIKFKLLELLKNR